MYACGPENVCQRAERGRRPVSTGRVDRVSGGLGAAAPRSEAGSVHQWSYRIRLLQQKEGVGEAQRSDLLYGTGGRCEGFLGDHLLAAPSTVGLRQTEYYCRGDDYASSVDCRALTFSFFSVLILCHLTYLILLPT